MSKLTLKLVGVVSALIAVICILITTTTILLSKSHNDKIMTDRATSGVKVLKDSVGSKLQQLQELSSLMLRENPTPDTVGDLWLKLNSSEENNQNSYGAMYNKERECVWRTNNYTSKPLNQGIVADKTSLCIQSVSESDDLLIVVGMDLSSTNFLDSVKNRTDAEMTLFLDDVRYGTTIMDSKGNRVTGTTMDTEIATKVLEQSCTYTTQTEIIGQNYYVCYEPIIDGTGNTVGAYFSGFSSAESDKSFTELIMVSVIITIVFIILSTVLLFIYTRIKISTPLLELNKISDDMCKGNLNLPDTKFTFGNDELGMFASNLTETKHHLNTYISDISSILQCMSGGDFTHTPSVDYVGDFTVIKQSFEKINEILKEIIESMNQSAGQVSAGAVQISEGAQLLAEGTTKQAAAIDELTATMEDISKQLTENAQNANTASELSVQSVNKILLQNEEMNDMMVAMSDISDKSNKIEDIIKTIEDIAFQTNILALNASIEAARAGEVDKGFAVVADEVRNLANKSELAAKTTEELINDTKSAVCKGSEITNKAVTTMKAVMESSEEVKELINSISEATSQQAKSVNEVSIGIAEISEVIQQNSATSQETASSCQELSSQAIILQEQVSKLKS